MIAFYTLTVYFVFTLHGRANFSVTFSAVSTKNIGNILVEVERLLNIDYEMSCPRMQL